MEEEVKSKFEQGPVWKRARYVFQSRTKKKIQSRLLKIEPIDSGKRTK